MKILITGATGFIGLALSKKLASLGHQVNVLSRDKLKAEKLFSESSIEVFEWSNTLSSPPSNALLGVEAVINLMGENIGGKRWSEVQKRKLHQSRVEATNQLVLALEKTLNLPLKVFISASAIGIYPVNSPSTLTEESRESSSFLGKLCHDWEHAVDGMIKVERKVFIRTGVVLEKDGGALLKMLPPFKMGLGGPIGNGNQMMSWIHRDDIISLYVKALSDEKMRGIFNGCSPHPVSNFDFTKALGSSLHRPTILPVPAIALKIAFGEMSTIMLDSQAVVSQRLNDVGFEFKYPTIESALKAIFTEEQSSHHEKKSLLGQA